MDALVAAWRAACPGSATVQGNAPSRRDLSPAELDRLASAVLRLQRGLTGERALVGSSYMDDPDALGAYLLYYWPVSYAQATRALNLSGLSAARALDLGSGPGPVAAAIADRLGASSVLVDSSEAALALAARLIPGAATLRADLESPEAVPGTGYGLVSFGHSLNEIAAGREDRIERRRTVLDRAAAVLVPGGSILVMEPATLAASRDAISLRDSLVADGWRVLAPCPHDRPCPALAAGPTHTCHDESTWDIPQLVSELARRAGLDRRLIKTSWFVLTPPAPSSAKETPLRYRVVSEPMLNKAGRIRYLLCGPEGRFPFSARRDDPVASEAGFFSLERYDLIRVSRPEIRENGWGMASGTEIERG